MKLERYELKAEKSLMVFEFVSEGPNGEIHKLVQFGETNLKDFYNLAFGDKDSATGEINDSIVSNNNDCDKVLATLVATVYAFTDKHPAAWVYATGSTRSRTRLYRMGITKYLSEIIRCNNLVITFYGKFIEQNQRRLLFDFPYGYGSDSVPPSFMSNNDFEEHNRNLFNPWRPEDGATS